MSAQWRLALWYAAWISLGALVAGAALWWFYGAGMAGAFGYGVGVGLLSLVSTALTVSLLTGRSRLGKAMGVASFLGRYGFNVLALGIPASLGLWPVVPMLGGFAVVYLAETVVLLPRVITDPGVRRFAGRPADERVVERRAEV